MRGRHRWRSGRLPDGDYVLFAFTELEPGSGGEPQYLAVEAGPRVIGE